MLYQVGLILILVAIALIFSKKFKKSDEKIKYIYEEDMDKDELDELDDEIN